MKVWWLASENNNTCNTEEIGTTIFIEGNPHDIMENMAPNSRLTAGHVENCHILALGGQIPSKFDTVIPMRHLYKSMVV